MALTTCYDETSEDISKNFLERPTNPINGDTSEIDGGIAITTEQDDHSKLVSISWPDDSDVVIFKPNYNPNDSRGNTLYLDLGEQAFVICNGKLYHIEHTNPNTLN